MKGMVSLLTHRPLALRAVCTCGGSGICEHVVATLEAVRSQTELVECSPHSEVDLSWLPAFRVESRALAGALRLAGLSHRRTASCSRRRWSSTRRACAARSATRRRSPR